MSGALGAGDSGQRGLPPQLPICKHCGGMASQMNLLDAREGKRFRLVRCISCEKLDWREEE
jgi:hypothetical protein